ncbi:hypothetical protein KAI54_02920 [Candidatus Gracilibacteria bacterium]|nr:hypothetical protein [Candidatus Gracilibacteria bacterium]
MTERNRNFDEVRKSASQNSEAYGKIEKPAERFLQSYVVGMRNVDELVRSNHPADIANVEEFTKLLQLKKNNGTITKEEDIFFRCLLVAVKLEKSVDNAPVLQILREDWLNPKIEKIREWIRGFIARRIT